MVEEDLPADFVNVIYVPDDEHMGRLHVRARFAGFEGRAEAWVDRREASEFAERLKQYPLDEHEPVTFSAGLGGIEFIGIAAAPVGGKGQVVLSIHLASEAWHDGKPSPEHDVTIEFPTSYEYLRRFSNHLHMVLDSQLDQASLDFDLLV